MRYLKSAIMLPVLTICSLVLNIGCSPEYNRKDAEDHFFKHENDFLILANYFDSLSKPFDSTFFIDLSIEDVDDGLIDFSACPQGLVDKDHPIIGGGKLKIEGSKVDSVLNKLGWSRSILDKLIDHLSKTDCPLIHTLQGADAPIEIQYRRSGLGIFSYYIYSSPPSEEIIKIQGKPISNSELGSRTIIKYLSAL